MAECHNNKTRVWTGIQFFSYNIANRTIMSLAHRYTSNPPYMIWHVVSVSGAHIDIVHVRLWVTACESCCVMSAIHRGCDLLHSCPGCLSSLIRGFLCVHCSFCQKTTCLLLFCTFFDNGMVRKPGIYH